MSHCRNSAPTVSNSEFNLYASSQISEISSMFKEGQKLMLTELQRGQSTPKRPCSRSGACQTPPNQRNLLSPTPDCVFSPKAQQSAMIGALADQAASFIVDRLIADSNALIPDLDPPTPTPRATIQRHPAQQSDDLMCFEEASPPVIQAPHSAARRFLNQLPKQAILYPAQPKTNLYSGTPTPNPGKWISHGPSRKVFVPEGSSMPR